MRALTLSILLALSGASTALAQDTGRSGEVTNYEFEDELVDGARFGTDYAIIEGTRRRARATLIRARAHFVPEMLQSVEHL